MATIYLDNQSMETHGNLVDLNQSAPNTLLTNTDLSLRSIASFKGQTVLINVYPSIDTAVCFQSVKTFQEALAKYQNIAFVCISMDLPFALSRVQEGEHLENIILLSDFRNRSFGDNYGLTISEGPLAGLLARSVIVLDKSNQVIHRELVSNISEPPDYESAISKMKDVI